LKTPLPEATVIETSGGNSNFKKIYHIVLKTYKKSGGNSQK